MFKFNGFTEKANDAVNLAIAQASVLGHTYIGSEHMLLGLLQEQSGVAYNILTYKNVTSKEVLDLLTRTVGKGVQSKLAPSDLTPRCKKILERSILESRLKGQNYVGTEHILLAMLKEKDCYAVKFLKEMGVDVYHVEAMLSDAVGKTVNQSYLTQAEKYRPNKKAKEKSNTPTLDKFGKDLTKQAYKSELDPVIERDKEIERVMQILSRRSKNNPCLIGEAGVGKTAIAEGLAQKIVDGKIPDTLKNKRIITLDIVSMLAGTKYRGEFEERVKRAIDEVVKDKNIILFIDEMHTIVGAGAAEGAIDASNIFKPQLARGELQIMGATTSEEYRKYIEKDSALDRRFQSVVIKEPNEEQTLKILRALRPRYEKHHNIKITDKALKMATELSARYITGRFLPDKAIDLIDEAASKVRMHECMCPKKVVKLEDNLKKLKDEKEVAICTQDFAKAAEIKEKEETVIEQIDMQKTQWQIEEIKNKPQVTEKNIAEVISVITGIDLEKLTDEKRKKLLVMEQELEKRVIGQHEAVTALSKAIRRGRIGLKDPKRPIGSFLFLGPTGVGKTELCKALAEIMFGKEDALITLDMSEYMEKNSATKMIGSPPGYVGYDDGGQLTEKIKRQPYSVILFDEIEKAHPDVYNILLQILEDGVLTDSRGVKINFKNTVIIMTSNVGAKYITDNKYMGFAKDNNVVEKNNKQDVLKELKRTFRPEFLNRIDDIIVFNKLTQQDIEKISQKLINQVKQRLKNLNISFTVSKDAIKQISTNGYDSSYGARPLRRYIQNNIENQLADMIISGNVCKNQCVHCDCEEKENYSFTVL